MLPWKTMITLQKSTERPVYLQVCDSVISEIKHGILKPGTKMPGTRFMASELGLNRQTVVKAYEELYSQGWIELLQSKGTFVSEHLPEVKPRRLVPEKNQRGNPDKAGFQFRINSLIHAPAKPNRNVIGFHDGPDVRIVPVDLLSRTYKSILNRKSSRPLLSYIDPEGSASVRKAISDYLNGSRGLQTEEKNIVVTRGTQMAMYLLAEILFSPGDVVVTADIGYRYAELTFLHAGAKLLRVPVDKDGIDVDAVEAICKKKKIRALYVTSHHHYPTTVTLCAPRRMKLLHLAEEYRFIIIEDDYDYEFHYESSPILPLASADRTGMVVYIGSFSKTITPAIRMGYIAATPDVLLEIAKLRMLIDVQGESILEQVITELLNEGEIRRHMKKALKVYRERRDFMCGMMKSELGNIIDFTVPHGGLSIWAKFEKRVNVPELSKALFKKEIVLSPGLLHNISAGRELNSTRMGFGWMNLREAERALLLMKETIRKL